MLQQELGHLIAHVSFSDARLDSKMQSTMTATMVIKIRNLVLQEEPYRFKVPATYCLEDAVAAPATMHAEKRRLKQWQGSFKQGILHLLSELPWCWHR